MKSIFYIVLFLLVLKVAGQNESAVTRYLQTAGSDKQMERFQEEMNFLSGNRMESSWIRETELRLATKGLNTSLEDYRVRISPTNPWEFSANKLYKKQLDETTRTRYFVSYSQSLRNRYLLLIEHYFHHQLIPLAEEEIAFRRKFAEQMIELESEEMDYEDLIGFESGLSKKEIDLAELRMELQEVQHMISLDFPGEITWGNFTLITPKRVAEFLQALDSADHQSLYKLEANQKLLLEEQMLRVSKAEAFSNIGFLQANYETDQGDDVYEHMGFQIGISLPLANRDKADLAREKFELIEEENKKDLTNQYVDQQIKILRSRLEASFNLYALLDKKLTRSAALQPTVENATNLFSIIKHSTYTTELRKKQAEVYQRILEDFIEYIELNGQLVQQPLRNYLSESLFIIE